MTISKQIYLPVLLLALSAIAPIGIHWVFPLLDNDPYEVSLPEIGPVVTKKDTEAKPIKASLIEQKAFRIFTIPGEHFQYRLDIPETARYTFFVLSAHDRSNPVNMHINDNPITGMAMYQKVDKPEFHKIKSNILLQQGSNTFTLKGTELKGRPTTLYIFQQSPITLSLYIVYWILTLILVLTTHILGNWAQKNETRKLTATLITTTAALFLILACSLSIQYNGMYQLGNSARGFENKLVEFDTHLKSQEYLKAKENRFTIATFGDSTHFYHINDPNQHHQPTLQRILDTKSQGTYYVYGIAHGGRTAHDYYYLANRIISEKPDLLIITLNVHTFSDQFQHSPFFYQPNVYRFLRLSEYLNTRNLYLGTKRIELVPYLGMKLDAWSTNFRLTPYFEGVRLYSKTEMEYWNNQSLLFITKNTPIEKKLPAKTPRLMWETNVSEANPMFEPIRLINNLTDKYNIPVLYYATPVNAAVLNAKGIDVRQNENYAFIKDRITNRPNIHYLDLSENQDPSIFSDGLEHLTTKGVRYITNNLADFILDFKHQQDEQP